MGAAGRSRQSRLSRASRRARSLRRVIRGLRYHFSCWGPAGRQTVLLLHGFMDCGRSFQFLADALPSKRFLLAPDWRGFGRTAWAAGGYWFADYLADLEAIIERFSPRGPVDLIGHSMGGNIACLYAGVRPERVRRIVSLEGFGLPRTSPAEAPSRLRRWLDELAHPARANRYPSYAALAEQLQQRNPRLDASKARFLARSLGRSDGRRGVVLRADPRHRRVNPVLYRIEEAQACWRAIEAPVLFVGGGESEYLRWLGAHARAHQAGTIPRLSVRVLARAGHMLHHDAPGRLARLIDHFLAGGPAEVRRR